MSCKVLENGPNDDPHEKSRPDGKYRNDLQSTPPYLEYSANASAPATSASEPNVM